MQLTVSNCPRRSEPNPPGHPPSVTTTLPHTHGLAARATAAAAGWLELPLCARAAPARPRRRQVHHAGCTAARILAAVGRLTPEMFSAALARYRRFRKRQAVGAADLVDQLIWLGAAVASVRSGWLRHAAAG